MVAFLGEQDGPMENTVKAQWLPILSTHPEIRRAFLVRAAYGMEAGVRAVLALCSNKRADSKLVEALRIPYAAIFSRDCTLDVAFVSAARESEIERVCPAFYTAASERIEAPKDARLAQTSRRPRGRLR